MLQRKLQKSLHSWVSFLPVAIFLTSCDSIIASGRRFNSPFPELSQIAVFSIAWLLPGLFLWVLASMDWSDMDIGYGANGIVLVPKDTGNMYHGDTSAGNFMANLWFAAYPIGYFYYTHLDRLTFPLTGFPNIDWLLFRIILPLSFLAVIVWFIYVIHTSSFVIFRWLVLTWQILVLLVSINLLGWLLALFIPWFLKLVVDLVLWLFQR
jgi:hypothetical protein